MLYVLCASCCGLQKGKSHVIFNCGKVSHLAPLQANLHFHAIWAWMKKQKLLPGKLHMIVDSSDTAWSPGRFGTGQTLFHYQTAELKNPISFCGSNALLLCRLRNRSTLDGCHTETDFPIR